MKKEEKELKALWVEKTTHERIKSAAAKEGQSIQEFVNVFIGNWEAGKNEKR